MPGNFQAEASLADHWGGVCLLFALFLGFFVAALGYGTRICRVPGRTTLLDRVGDAFLGASVVLYAGSFLLCATHTLRLLPSAGWAAVFLPGLPLVWPLLKECAARARAQRSVALVVVAAVLLVRALGASLPAQHGDPLLYHLLGPRLWVEGGGFLMHPNLPNALLAASWECLYVWPQLFWFGSRPLYGLVEAQIFSQWLHLFLAWVGCGLLVWRLMRGLAKEQWLPVAALAAMFVAGVQWTAPLAKNDVGIAFWALGAVVYFREARGGRAYVWSGVFAGLALSGKITALLSLAPLLGALLLVRWLVECPAPRAELLRLLGWLAGFAAGAVPVYARNFVLSRNPFFPLFPNLFPSPWMSRSWQAHFAQVHPGSPLHALPRIWQRLPELGRESPWIMVAGVMVMVALAARKRQLLPAQAWALLAGSFAAYLLFVVTQAPEIELRYLGASLMILTAAGVVALLHLVELLPGPVGRRGGAALVLVAVLAASKLPTHLLWKIWPSPLGAAYVRTHSAGEAKAWVRARSEGRLTVLAGDNETYYLTPVPVAVLTERPDFDAANERTQLAPFVRTLCELSHARYLLDARPEIGLESRFGAAAIAGARVFSAQGSNVYDLRLLEQATGSAPYYCQ